MKKQITGIIFLLVLSLSISAQTADRSVEKIRKIYTDVAEKARLAETDDEQGQFGELVMSELVINKRSRQWRAVGIYGETFRFFYKGGNSEAHLYPDELVLVKAERRVSNRKYAEEYLFDGSGRLIFYFQRSENDDQAPAERRIYIDAARVVRVTEDGKSRDKLTAADLAKAREAATAAARIRDVFARAIKL